jgi:hypothetical protein
LLVMVTECGGGAGSTCMFSGSGGRGFAVH